MVEKRVIILGFLIVIAFILYAVGTFTPAWIVNTIKTAYTYPPIISKKTAGIVPYYTNEYSWLAAGSWLIFISFGLFFAIFAAYAQAFNTSRNGFSHGNRLMFHIIAGASAIIVIFSVIAVILIGVNSSKQDFTLDLKFTKLYYTFSLGYSAWLCVASAVITLVVSLMSEHIAIAYCQ